MEVAAQRCPTRIRSVALRVQVESLQRLVKLADGLLLIDALVALETFNGGVCRESDYLGQFRLPGPRRSLREDRFLHLRGQIDHLQRHGIGHIPRGIQSLGQLFDRGEHGPSLLEPHVRAESLQSLRLILRFGAQRDQPPDASPSNSAISDDHVGFFYWTHFYSCLSSPEILRVDPLLLNPFLQFELADETDVLYRDGPTFTHSSRNPECRPGGGVQSLAVDPLFLIPFCTNAMRSRHERSNVPER